MSALADALAQAQTRAVAALGKQYVGGTLEDAEVRQALEEIGLTDPTDTDRWLACLNVIQATGAALPRENGAPQKEAPATQAQRDRIKRDLAPLHGADAAAAISGEATLTKAQASEIISSLVAGTFELDKWAVPF